MFVLGDTSKTNILKGEHIPGEMFVLGNTSKTNKPGMFVLGDTSKTNIFILGLEGEHSLSLARCLSSGIPRKQTFLARDVFAFKAQARDVCPRNVPLHSAQYPDTPAVADLTSSQEVNTAACRGRFTDPHVHCQLTKHCRPSQQHNTISLTAASYICTRFVLLGLPSG